MKLLGCIPRRRYFYLLLLISGAVLIALPLRISINTERTISMPEKFTAFHPLGFGSAADNKQFNKLQRQDNGTAPSTEQQNKIATQPNQQHGTAATKGYDGIPKIIHQTWKSDVIPEAFQENVKGLAFHNKPPEWKYFFWTDESGERFIKKAYPDLSARYGRARDMVKADILRLAVLHHYGGAYFDMDTVSVKPLDHYVESHICSFTTDPPEHLFNHFKSYREQIITNCVMLCKPGNWFIWHMIEQLVNQSVTCKDAIACTGPGIITKEYERFQATNMSKHLPFIEDSQLFTDKMTSEAKSQAYLNEHCVKKYNELKYEWSKEICRDFVHRGGSNRNISDKAYTYHTWFHTTWYPNKVQKGSQKKIQDLIPHVTFYT